MNRKSKARIRISQEIKQARVRGWPDTGFFVTAMPNGLSSDDENTRIEVDSPEQARRAASKLSANLGSAPVHQGRLPHAWREALSDIPRSV